MKPDKIQLLFYFLFLFIFIMGACDEDSYNRDGDEEKLVFELLTTEKDTLVPGGQTRIKATASGVDLVYHWSATAGDLLGSGKTITYTATVCVHGNVEITCKIEDALLNNDEKTVRIFVE